MLYTWSNFIFQYNAKSCLPQKMALRRRRKKFWSELDELVKSIPREERVLIGADFKGHVG